MPDFGQLLTATPAADLTMNVAKSGKLIIVNLASTPLDKIAYMKINGLCEEVGEENGNQGTTIYFEKDH